MCNAKSSGRNVFLSSSLVDISAETKNVGISAGVLPYDGGSDNVLSDVTNRICITISPMSGRDRSGNLQILCSFHKVYHSYLILTCHF